MSKDFRRANEYVSITNVATQTRARGIRFFCPTRPEAHGRYALQLFAPQQRSNGQEGKRYMIATAPLAPQDLVALRAAIDGAITKLSRLASVASSCAKRKGVA